ncbi:MAG TPA: hypothetical protein VMU09_09480 [Acidimicrobiales bacterium]|nr:hypothetical protein [Acidimicrobiales bacterium]
MTPEILVAHSSGVVRDVIGGILTRRGHDVKVAYNTSTALEVLDAGGVEVLLVSQHLPPGGYGNILDTLAQPPPAVVICERGQPVPHSIEQDQRVSGVLARPFSLQDLFALVEAATEGRSPGAQ